MLFILHVIYKFISKIGGYKEKPYFLSFYYRYIAEIFCDYSYDQYASSIYIGVSFMSVMQW